MNRRRQLIRDREIDERDDEADPRLHDNRDDGSLFERGDGREAADAEDQDSDDDFRPYSAAVSLTGAGSSLASERPQGLIVTLRHV